MNTNSIEPIGAEVSSAMEIAEKSALAGHIFGVLLVGLILWMIIRRLYQCMRGGSSFTHKFTWFLFGGAFAVCLGLSFIRIALDAIHMTIIYLNI
ncbi:TPA: hypothetical protein I7730_01350 [Vibrio vulnificus]|uniref:Uncharacterized protein n=1 Tax=Vibrio vulnificus TaxID=672 RepID=A0A8H9K793_VIBVL|nr:hypothetical protein [Vibrio vulnificus]